MIESFGRRLGVTAVLAGLALVLIGCPSTSSSISAPPIPPQVSFEVLGTPGTPFSAVLSDFFVSYTISGAVPMAIGFIRNHPPVRMICAKTVGNNNLLSLQIFAAGGTIALQSTSQPFGSVQAQFGGILPQIAPAASPDVRFFVKAPAGETFNALIEDSSTAFATQAVAPALFLFESPNGTVDGLFNQVTNLGNFHIDLIFNGAVIATGIGGPSITVK